MVVFLFAADFFSRFWHQLAVILLSCVPIIESRYAIILCAPVFKEIGTTELIILTQIGSCLTALILLLLLKPVMKWMKSTKLFKSLIEKIEHHGNKKGKKLQGKIENSKTKAAKIWLSVIGVFVFVAVPLPGTGVWTGCLVATLLDIRFRYAFPAVVAGSACATLIMVLFSEIFLKGVI